MGEEERILIEKIRQNGLKGFDELINQYKGRIYTLCLKIMGEHEEADDCAQETFIKVFRYIGSFQFKSSFYTWIYRIAVNTCKNRLKSAQYRRSRKSRSADTGSILERLNSGNKSPDEDYETHILQARILDTIQHLKEDSRILVILRDLDGRSYEEIAEITGLNQGTVKSRLARAREAIRTALAGENE